MQQYTDIEMMRRFPLSTKKPLKKTILNIGGQAFLTLIVLSFIAFATHKEIAWLIGDSWVIAEIVLFIGFIMVIGLGYLYERAYYRSYYYNIADNHLIIKKGVFGIHEVTIPLERIQDVYIDQDPLDYLFGLYDVHFSSATAMSGQQAHIDGVERDVAQNLRQHVLALLKQRK